MYALLILLAVIAPTATFAMQFDLYVIGGNCNGCQWIGGDRALEDAGWDEKGGIV